VLLFTLRFAIFQYEPLIVLEYENKMSDSKAGTDNELASGISKVKTEDQDKI